MLFSGTPFATSVIVLVTAFALGLVVASLVWIPALGKAKLRITELEARPLPDVYLASTATATATACSKVRAATLVARRASAAGHMLWAAKPKPILPTGARWVRVAPHRAVVVSPCGQVETWAGGRHAKPEQPLAAQQRLTGPHGRIFATEEAVESFRRNYVRQFDATRERLRQLHISIE
jgi:hypothetical protein